MKIERIKETLKDNGYGREAHYTSGIIQDDEYYNDLYQKSKSLSEFEKDVLSNDIKNCAVYSKVSRYGTDSENHWYRVRGLFGNEIIKTYSDVGSLMVGNDSFSTLISNGYGDGTTRVGIVNKCDENIKKASLCEGMMDNCRVTLKGTFNIYPYDCDAPSEQKPILTLTGNYFVYNYDGIIALVEF